MSFGLSFIMVGVLIIGLGVILSQSSYSPIELYWGVFIAGILFILSGIYLIFKDSYEVKRT